MQYTLSSNKKSVNESISILISGLYTHSNVILPTKVVRFFRLNDEKRPSLYYSHTPNLSTRGNYRRRDKLKMELFT
jgi:hypothetical protein